MEPILIATGVFLPMLLATEFCANCFTESCNNVLGIGLAMLQTFLETMKQFK
jgi:hypothetical protein